MALYLKRLAESEKNYRSNINKNALVEFLFSQIHAYQEILDGIYAVERYDIVSDLESNGTGEGDGVLVSHEEASPSGEWVRYENLEDIFKEISEKNPEIVVIDSLSTMPSIGKK